MNTQAAGQALEAMRESGQRAVLGGVAGLQEQAQLGSEQLRLAMQGDLYNRNLMIAEEEANIRDRLASIDLNQATGAQQAAADARVMGAQSVESGLANLAGAGATIYEATDLYKRYNDEVKGGLGGIFPRNPKSVSPSIGGVGSFKGSTNRAAGIIPKPKFKLPTGF